MAWYGGRHQISTAWCWMMIAAVTVESKGLCMDMDPMQYCSVESLTCGSWPARQWTQVSVGGALFIMRLCLDLSARSTSGPTRALTTHAESSHTERHEVGQQMPVSFSHKLVGWLGSLGRNHFCLSASEYSKRMPYTMPEPDNKTSKYTPSKTLCAWFFKKTLCTYIELSCT